ncbi:uncharacterized protein isoform X1 [Leptinotarsa decemlineata]|uniref:uncharacterized protein isoform X1 n=1 Tax=Leptinotarsa decemlineata TaxID=7539 RepID=UPI003D30BFA2
MRNDKISGTPRTICDQDDEQQQHRCHRHAHIAMDPPWRIPKETQEKAPLSPSQTPGSNGRPTGADPGHPRGFPTGIQIADTCSSVPEKSETNTTPAQKTRTESQHLDH